MMSSERNVNEHSPLTSSSHWPLSDWMTIIPVSLTDITPTTLSLDNDKSNEPKKKKGQEKESSQESTVYSPVLNNEINNEPDNEINNEVNNEHLHITEFLNHDRKKRRMIKTTKPSAFSTPIQINSSRTNASYTRFFFEDNKKYDQIKYYKICVKEYKGTHIKPYPYSKSGGSIGHLTYHLRERHNITANNYKEHLDSSQEPIVKVNLITNYITNLPSLSTKRQNELIKVLIEFIVYDIQPLYILQDSSFQFVEEVVDVLKPFEEITRHFSGFKYSTINLIYPYIPLIYGSLPENSEQISENLSDDDTSVSSSDEANIPSAGTRQQWQYAHRRLKASMLDPRVLKLLLFATEDEHRNTKAQIHAELSILEAQFRQNNDKIEACITTEKEEYDLLSAELWGSLSTPTPQTITEDELTNEEIILIID
ncbi:5785_t:CDS:2 [Cetraspora pellucida]|uniref:5785_t:CDS:1 n=1 Tax=Cetraspora pellucida TaxID=1433469 RepID=A0A9N9C276_9GLOM|nr:5785_t:CDS:2 [Cetraspora pellucida]